MGFLQGPVYKPHHNTPGKHWKKEKKTRTQKQSQWVSCRDLSINLTVIWLAGTGKPHPKHSENVSVGFLHRPVNKPHHNTPGKHWKKHTQNTENFSVGCLHRPVNKPHHNTPGKHWKNDNPKHWKSLSVGFLQGHVYKPPCSTISRHWKTQTQNTEKVSQWVSCRHLSINLTVIRLAGTGKTYTKHPQKC